MNILKMNHYLRREVEMVDLIEEFFSPYRVFKIGGTIQKLFKAFTKNSIHFSPTKRLKADWLRLKFLQLTPNRLKALVANNSEMFYIN